MKSDRVYLLHILEAIKKIEEYTEGYTYEQFRGDEKTVDAVLRKLEMIGEAGNNASEDLRQNHSEVPWRNMIDMRNVVIHEYFGVIKKTVWDTIHEDIPSLKTMVEQILAGLSEEKKNAA